jgi:hypothetical protein
MTPETFLQLIREHSVTVGVQAQRWYAGVIVATSDLNVFSYAQEKGRDPVEAVEKLAVRLGWIEEMQGDLFKIGGGYDYTIPETQAIDGED